MPENAEPKVGEVWRRTLRHDGGLIQTDEGPILGVDGEFVTVGHHRLRWQFGSTQVQTTWEKLADAPQAEPGPGSIVLDANYLVWRRSKKAHDAPWSYTGYPDGFGWEWGSSGIAKPVRVLYDPSALEQS